MRIVLRIGGEKNTIYIFFKKADDADYQDTKNFLEEINQNLKNEICVHGMCVLQIV